MIVHTLGNIDLLALKTKTHLENQEEEKTKL